MHALNRARYGVPLLALLPGTAAASAGGAGTLNLTNTNYAMIALAVFILAYAFVILEEFLHLRKSKPVLVAAGIVWILVALAYGAHGDHTTPRALLGHNMLEYVELFLFLLAAMTYINTLEERRVFDALRAWLVSRGLSFRALFWVTGLLAFFISPMLGMMTGLGVLNIYGYFLRRDEISGMAAQIAGPEMLDLGENKVEGKILDHYKPRHKPFDIFISMKRAEWDTLLFFYGVILCVGGLGALGYLTVVSELIYTDLGPTKANVLVGFLSSVVDNIPVMFAVLTMNPEMSTGQWLLVTLTAGVGGSLLSIGSAAGVALMGQRAVTTRFSITSNGRQRSRWVMPRVFGCICGLTRA